MAREGAKAGDDRFSIEDGTGPGGVGVRVAEERIDGSFAEGVVATGDDLVEIDERDVLLFSDGLGPAAVGFRVAANVAVDPDFARHERAKDGRGAFGADIGDVLAQVPAEGVYEFGFVSELVFYFECLVASAGQATAGVGAAGHAGARSWRRSTGR